MGDCAYEIVIRTLLVHKGNAPVDKLNRKASRLAKAETQSQIITAIQEQLTEEELTMYKRGRNAKSYTSAKNASINPIPYLAAEFVAANTWSMALIIGNPTNIYLVTAIKTGIYQFFINIC